MTRFFVLAIVTVVSMMPQLALAQFRCPGNCPRGNCVKVCPQGAPPTCNDYCADAIRPLLNNDQSPRSDLTIIIPDTTPDTAAKVRALLNGKSK
jgi:hypothetical protein